MTACSAYFLTSRVFLYFFQFFTSSNLLSSILHILSWKFLKSRPSCPTPTGIDKSAAVSQFSILSQPLLIILIFSSQKMLLIILLFSSLTTAFFYNSAFPSKFHLDFCQSYCLASHLHNSTFWRNGFWQLFCFEQLFCQVLKRPFTQAFEGKTSSRCRRTPSTSKPLWKN